MRYVSLKNTTWHYARNYPKDVRALLGRYKFKQSLRTSDAKVATERAVQVNARYEDNVRRVRAGLDEVQGSETWARELQATLTDIDIGAVGFAPKVRRSQPVWVLVKRYLSYKGHLLAPSAFKAVRYSLGLFASEYGKRAITRIDREDGREFLHKIQGLSAGLGKSSRYHGASLATLLRAAENRADKITVTTQKRIWELVGGFLDWAVYEGHIKDNPFKTVRFEGRVQHASYAVLSDPEVKAMMSVGNSFFTRLFVLCLLTGMRSGEALGLRRQDLIRKGNLGTFVRVSPNEVRGLKTQAADRLVPLHPNAEEVLRGCPEGQRLFPDLVTNHVTKWFRRASEEKGIYRPGLVFHSTRKWFITQCERQGVPEHFTASLVGHTSARSGNGITYAIYSGGISDEQKRQIVDQLMLPA
jgi:integrase